MRSYLAKHFVVSDMLARQSIRHRAMNSALRWSAAPRSQHRRLFNLRPSGHWRQSRALILSSGFVLGVAGACFALEYPMAECKHAWQAAQRTYRVVSTLVACVIDYRLTLGRSATTDLDQSTEMSDCHTRCAQRALSAIKMNGSIFIKLGQHLSSMTHLLPIEWTEAFIPLQDHSPTSSYESIDNLFLRDTGSAISDYFEEFDAVPIGAASLAQVHRAVPKHSSDCVAVKIQHPSLQTWIPLDLALTRLSFQVMEFFFPSLDMRWLAEEMEVSLPQELDFRKEAQFADITREHFATQKTSPLIVPEIKWAMKRILVMEYMPGHRPDDLQYLDSNQIDRDEVSTALADIFNEMIFADTPLHCDPHGGNIAIQKNNQGKHHNFSIVLYDHGLYRDIPQSLRYEYARLWLSVFEGNESCMRESAQKLAGITDDQFPLFASMMTCPDLLTDVQSNKTLGDTMNVGNVADLARRDVLEGLIQILGGMPRVLLLILKTNDLTRTLDERLQTKDGPLRNFSILVHYSSRTILKADIGRAYHLHGQWSLRTYGSICRAWTSFVRVQLKLKALEMYIIFSRAWHSYNSGVDRTPHLPRIICHL